MGGKLPLGGLFFSHRFSELRTEFWAILVSMNLNRVLGSGIDKFTLTVR